MKATDVVREIMKSQDVGLNKMADRMGKTPRLVSDRLSQDNISISKLNEMLQVLDYKVLVVPRDCKKPSGSYDVD